MMDFLIDLLPQGADRVLMQIGGAIGVGVSFCFGDDVGHLLWWLIIFVCLDFVTGILGAIYTHQWTSRKCSRGIVRKIMIFVMVALAHGLDEVFASMIHVEIMESIVICAYTAAEFGSIIENLEKAGYGEVIPPVLRRIVSTLNQKAEEKAEELIAGKKRLDG